jgi:hypothetical protein
VAHAQSVVVDVMAAEATTVVVVAVTIVADAAVMTAVVVAVQAATTVAHVASQTADQSQPSQPLTMPSPSVLKTNSTTSSTVKYSGPLSFSLTANLAT